MVSGESTFTDIVQEQASSMVTPSTMAPSRSMRPEHDAVMEHVAVDAGHSSIMSSPDVVDAIAAWLNNHRRDPGG